MLARNNGPHAAGIFADMTVDGPEIGTLVLIVDRAKNLPNRKTMGKQNPYCAARLGKEAKKTETDKRGGQTPKWDQELRFTVHDSPDYHTLKVSVFSEDKKTDLIGEAWVNLDSVVIPGGGKSDIWQGLNCKGKYAGEVRIELTYYDSRPKPEPSEEDLATRAGKGKVKRRPLPSNPNSGSVTPDTIPELAGPVRAKHGPRDLSAPPRMPSMPRDTMGFHHSQMHSLYGNQPIQHGLANGETQTEQPPPHDYSDEPEAVYPGQQPYIDPYQQPDFLPQLAPSNRQRAGTQVRYASSQALIAPLQPRPLQATSLQHSQSAPMVPTQQEPEVYEDGSQLNTEYSERIPNVDYQHQRVRQRRMDVPPSFQQEYGDAYPQTELPAELESPPPPPPAHSNSAPAVPQFAPSPVGRYGSAPPPGARHNSVPNTSPLQRIERGWNSPQQMVHGQPARGRSVDDYGSAPERNSYGGAPSSHTPGQSPSPYSRSSPAGRGTPQRHSVADLYGQTPPRPHPLSQQVPRARSPLPEVDPRYEQSSYDHQASDAAPPLIKPRALSPQPAMPAVRPRSSYSIQHPVRAHESSDKSPLSASRPDPRLAHLAGSTPPARKSVSSRPSPIDSGSPSVPFSPDSFDSYNPNARPSPLAASPHAPYQVRGGAENAEERKGPIVGWHGQEIDPSDHLPVDSWAPEPEKKTPTKTYGLGRDRDFGPRTSQGGVRTSGGRISKDTVVTMRMKGASGADPGSIPASAGRNRLQKKAQSPGVEPLREHRNYNSTAVPNPYEQQEYSRHGGFGSSSSHSGYGAPTVPPKVPFSSEEDALAREISSIAIGSGRYGRPSNASVPAPTAYVPVRSHRDRQSYY
ncbi:Protein kinase C conserved region 2 (CalB) [Teratosphaeria destructans]|uniref:Protein kinase C conserved region 2 (CalB) n=1 Tax=Teratosphaeria destructans TaxID=418781 RepID=A0A9W7W4D6_9PEZI|nr:Protein kinase C conserved region 2 (CalB) [Teratosphaeria destructans]